MSDLGLSRCGYARLKARQKVLSKVLPIVTSAPPLPARVSRSLAACWQDLDLPSWVHAGNHGLGPLWYDYEGHARITRTSLFTSPNELEV